MQGLFWQKANSKAAWETWEEKKIGSTHVLFREQDQSILLPLPEEGVMWLCCWARLANYNQEVNNIETLQIGFLLRNSSLVTWEFRKSFSACGRRQYISIYNTRLIGVSDFNLLGSEVYLTFPNRLNEEEPTSAALKAILILPVRSFICITIPVADFMCFANWD